MKNKQHPHSREFKNGIDYIENRSNIGYLFGEIRQAFNPKTDIVVISPSDLEKALRLRDSRWLYDNQHRVVTIESLSRPSIVRAGGGLNFAGGFFKS